MEQVSIRAWGNSQGIRITKDIMDELGLAVSDVLDVETSKDTIILRKAFRHKTFEERLADYDNEISVADFEWGEPLGKEIL
ncbi:MAG: AbrB/MazE/SpoVT family DNA-binding domain-containing protein [Lachnospiraceae bacterium]|nr:AbrB/MazE/SpoVT family DNA-binding domain-containing protein [Lachnospiraceae bacterium]